MRYVRALESRFVVRHSRCEHIAVIIASRDLTRLSYRQQGNPFKDSLLNSDSAETIGVGSAL